MSALSRIGVSAARSWGLSPVPHMRTSAAAPSSGSAFKE
ncbi:hypothetical protein [Azospirillum argentinense]